MKKLIISSLIIILLVVGVLMASCAPASKITPIKIGGGSVGGSWFPMMTATMVVLNENIPEIVSTVIPGGSLVNARKIGEGELDLGLIYTTTALEAWHGNDPFEKEYTNIRAIGKYITSGYQYGVNADSDIYSIADLHDKRIAIGVKGSGTELSFKQLLALYDITYDSVRAAGGKIEFLGYAEGQMALKDRAVDVAIFDGLPPDPKIVEIEIAFPLRVISIEENILAQMADKYGYGQMTIPAGVYKGTPEGATFMTVSNMLSARVDLPEDLIYKVTYSIYENLERLGEVYAKLKLMDLATSAEGIPTPLHPRAEKYWKEKGLS